MQTRGRRRGSRGAEPLRYFAATLPGLGVLLRSELEQHPAVDPDGEVGFDGRADLVFFTPRRGSNFQPRDLRLAEDVFVQLGSTQGGSARDIAGQLVTATGLERALSTLARLSRPLKAAMTFRAITRVRDEGRFKRTELRQAVTRAVVAQRPRWRMQDPSELEIWVLEHRDGTYVAGLRLTDKSQRQHGTGRAAERHGALRPVVAAAMVRLAGTRPGSLLDPCCGTGTILGEALAVGWDAYGSDLDLDAVRLARDNVPAATIDAADALALPHPDESFDAIVSNLPFGRQFRVETNPLRWQEKLINEASRVTRPGGRLVLLVPKALKQPPVGVTLDETFPITLLGLRTRIWVYQRSPSADRSASEGRT